MKLRSKLILSLAVSLLATIPAYSQTIPSDGSDLDFSPTNNIVIDLSIAVPGLWNANNSANAGKGIYDSNKWAVVYKFGSVNIPAGVTVTFINHPSHAPVVWLVAGTVQIDGTLSVAGQSGTTDGILRLTPSEPGPGGFRGGAYSPALGGGTGYGPGTANPQFDNTGNGFYASEYGNPQIIPLIGGSGGSGTYIRANNGGAGGGAILIAAAGGIAINGLITANGGAALFGGSGGAIRLIAPQVSGNGQVTAFNPSFGGPGGLAGRIRIETTALAPTLQTTPVTIAVAPAAIPIIWPADDAPTVRVASVDGTPIQGDPTAPLVSAADIPLQNNGTVQVILETKNFPLEGVVQLRTVQKYGPAAWVTATNSAGTFAQATWIANVTFAPGFTTLQARATVP